MDRGQQLTHCPTCGAPNRDTASRGPLTVKSEPLEMYWHGRRIPGVPPMRVRILFPLVRFGEVSSGVLDMLLSERASSHALKAHISNLRATFRQEGIPARIVNILGWGYRLEVSAETLPP